MKDEIKEILDYLSFLENIETQKKVQQVKDYITNLQKENKKLKKDNKVANIVIKNQDEEIDWYVSKNQKALDKLYCYGEVFDRKILQQFQKEMVIILKGE